MIFRKWFIINSNIIIISILLIKFICQKHTVPSNFSSKSTFIRNQIIFYIPIRKKFCIHWNSISIITDCSHTLRMFIYKIVLIFMWF